MNFAGAVGEAASSGHRQNRGGRQERENDSPPGRQRQKGRESSSPVVRHRLFCTPLVFAAPWQNEASVVYAKEAKLSTAPLLP